MHCQKILIFTRSASLADGRPLGTSRRVASKWVEAGPLGSEGHHSTRPAHDHDHESMFEPSHRGSVDAMKKLSSGMVMSSAVVMFSPVTAAAESSPTPGEAANLPDLLSTVSGGAFGSLLGIVGCLALVKLAEEDSELTRSKRDSNKNRATEKSTQNLVAQSFLRLKDAAPILTSLIAIGGIAAGGFSKLSSIERAISNSDSKFAETTRRFDEQNKRFDEQNKRIDDENQNIRTMSQQIFQLALRQAQETSKSGVSGLSSSAETPALIAPSEDLQKTTTQQS